MHNLFKILFVTMAYDIVFSLPDVEHVIQEFCSLYIVDITLLSLYIGDKYFPVVVR